MVGRLTGRLRINPAEPKITRSSSSTKTSITRTGLSSTIQSSRPSGKSGLCPRSIPLNKALHPIPLQTPQESCRANQMKRRVFTARVKPGCSEAAALCPLFQQMDTSLARRPVSLGCGRGVHHVPANKTKRRSRSRQAGEGLFNEKRKGLEMAVA
jgi:hypothetical protein